MLLRDISIYLYYSIHAIGSISIDSFVICSIVLVVTAMLTAECRHVQLVQCGAARRGIALIQDLTGWRQHHGVSCLLYTNNERSIVRTAGNARF